MPIRRLLLALPLLLFAAVPAQAQLLSTCLSLTITVSPLAFSSYLPANAAQNSTDIKVSCGFGLFVLPNITVALNGGHANSFAPRKMSPTSGSDQLGYNIYTASDHGSVWGDGTNGTVTQNVSGALLGEASYTFTAFGLIPAGQYVTATGYSDQITVQVTF